MHTEILKALGFAAEKHRDHRRKDANASPYINHLIAAALILAEEGRVNDEELLVAAILHDTVEDTETSFPELEEHFGSTIAGLVAEVTDDKSLKKAVRKRLQEEHAPKASPRAKQLKIADKISNIRDIVHYPPSGWPLERRLEYLAWAQRVVAGCRGINERLDQAFDRTVSEAARQLKRTDGKHRASA